MKAKAAIMATIWILISLGISYAEDGTFSGEVSVTGVIVDGKNDNAKFNEYRDIRTGVYGSADVQYQMLKDHVEFEAKDIGYNTQSYTLDAGRWDTFRMKLNYDEIPHNFTYDARTFYAGAGTNNLTFNGYPPGTNPNKWNTFDYSTKRKNAEGSLQLDMFKPFFLDLSANEQQKRGTYPIGVAGTSPGGISIEIPSFRDYKTDNIRVETGYRTKPYFFTLGYLYSQFDNGDGLQDFRNPATANTAVTTDTTYLPPDNDFQKFDFQGGVSLPYQSRFNVNLSSSRARSNSKLLPTSFADDVTAATSNIGVQGRTGISPSSPYFNGKLNTDNYNFVLNSNPIAFFDVKLFYKYLDKINKSDNINTVEGTEVLSNSLFDYIKNSYGLETGFKLPASFRLTAAYSYTQTDRQREDLPRNRDNLVDVNLKWSGLDFAVLKVGYENLHRSAVFNSPPGPVVDLEPWIRRFDAAPLYRDTFKASAEFFPVENLDIDIGYKFKRTSYTDTILGLTDSMTDDVNFNVNWQAHKQLLVYGYIDFEQIVNHQYQRQIGFGASPTPPYSPPTAAAFNWTAALNETTYAYGVGANISVIPQTLSLELAQNSVKSTGTVDLTYLLGSVPFPAGRNQDNIDLNPWDNYRLNDYVVKVVYQMTKIVALTAAYAYEEFSYDDSQYDGYLYYVPGSAGGYLTGAYNNSSYKTNIVLLGANIKF
jgi:MtrB/PioB family decaheme-associated outer membrane protein